MSTIFISIQTQEAHREAGDHTEEAIRDRCLTVYEGFHLPSNSIKLKHRNENKGVAVLREAFPAASGLTENS